MMEVLKIAALFGAALASVWGMNRQESKIRHRVERDCHCSCGYVNATWPWDYPGVLQAGETYRWAWGGGVMVCVAPHAAHPVDRLADIQREIRLFELARMGGQ